ncbi:CocE/NonD family hydrolase [Aerococcus vaginalis]
MKIIDKQLIHEIGQELFATADYTTEMVLGYFNSVRFPQNVHDQLKRLLPQQYTTPTDLLEEILAMTVTRRFNVLEELIHSAHLPQFLANYRPEGPLVFHDCAITAYDERQSITERIFVESDYATTDAEYGDLTEVYIRRPKEITKGEGVPIVFVADPYMMGANEESFTKHLHPNKEDYSEPINDVKLTLELKPAKHRPIKETATATQTAEWPNDAKRMTFYEHYVSRGYAIVIYAGRGAYYSEGFNVTGTQLEVEAVDSVLRWVNGDAHAFYDLEGETAVACDWSNGAVGMTGRSYLGTLQIGVATQTKSPALKTIVPEAAIASWYDYYRYNGLVVAPEGFIGEDIDLLSWFCESFLLNPTNAPKARKAAWQTVLNNITHDMDRGSGQYNAFWDGGNYLKDAANLTVPYLLVHGTNDWNVKPSHPFKLLEATAGTNTHRHFIIHRGEHISLHSLLNYDYLAVLDRWFDHWLLNVGTWDWQDGQGIVQSQWDADDWSLVDTTQTKNIDWQIAAAQRLTTADSDQSQEIVSFQDKLDYPTVNAWEAEIVDPESDTSAVYLSEPLNEALHIHGISTLELNLKTDHAPGALSAWLVDFGEGITVDQKMETLSETERVAWQREIKQTRFNQMQTTTSYRIVTRSWMNLLNTKDHRITLETDFDTDHKHDYALDFVGIDTVIPKGHQLGLVIFGYDRGYTLLPDIERHFELDEASVKLTLSVLKK